ncbi:prepilin peptidase [Brevibacillus sp. SYP-B805]|uniref:prepilin peptidase n=1 Tax=Brevibacillus sp. SYP-B805 TaxID=1578199 RepID=UPI0013EDD833|nr:A24 family peptidase [Brevibacillus sp. SYP-B805]NGQ94318.1 prepilin peptidase [Brevibacillus sp. SYP-B805]
MAPLDIFLLLFFFLLGLIFGSFFNVVALRVPRKQSIIRPPSHCPKCRRRLNALDLLPVLGYLLRRGKCASCGGSIPILYPLAELGTGLLFALAYIERVHEPGELLVALALASLCVIVSISDIVYRRIPNAVLLVFLPILLILRLFFHPQPFLAYVIGGAVGFLVLFLIAVIKPGAIGMGDVKLLGVLGLAVGWQALVVTLFLSSLLGLLLGIGLMLAGKVKWKGSIPFGPSLCAGALLAYFYGPELLAGYLSLYPHF